jgi:YfiH family protein
MTTMIREMLAMSESVVVAFTNRLGGVSKGRFAQANLSTRVGDNLEDVLANRAAVLSRLNLASRALVTLQQEHTATVVRIDGASRSGAVADGMVTTDRNVVLMVGVADCLPLALVDRGNAIGVLHVGWRGLLGGIVETGVREMLLAGAHRSSISAHLGPAIGPCCYEVGEDLRRAASAAYDTASAATVTGRPSIDLASAVVQALGRQGVEDVEANVLCTRESPHHFSRRRDGPTGCQAGLVALL